MRAIIWTNDARIIVKRPKMLSIQSVVLYKTCKPKPRPFCSGLNVLIMWNVSQRYNLHAISLVPLYIAKISSVNLWDILCTPRNMDTTPALLCFVVVWWRLISLCFHPYRHRCNLAIILSQCHWSNPEEYGLINHMNPTGIPTAKQTRNCRSVIY